MDSRQITPTAPEPLPARPDLPPKQTARRAPIWKALGYIQYRRSRRYVIQTQRGDIWELRPEEMSTGKLLEFFQNVEYWKSVHPRLSARQNITTRIDARLAAADIIRACLAVGEYKRPVDDQTSQLPQAPPYT